MTVFFDLDGTLLDTSQDFIVAMNKILPTYGLPPANERDLKDAISFGSKRMIESAFKIDNITENEHDKLVEDLVPKFLQYYKDHNFESTVAFPGINELLDTLDERNIKWGIVTNKHTALTEPLLEKIGYNKRTRCIVCGDTTSKPKPSPEPLLHACNLLQVKPEESIFIGDSINDIKAGQACGMKTITAAFGFIPKNTIIEDWQADAIAQTPHDILPWINKWVQNTN